MDPREGSPTAATRGGALAGENGGRRRTVSTAAGLRWSGAAKRGCHDTVMMRGGRGRAHLGRWSSEEVGQLALAAADGDDRSGSARSSEGRRRGDGRVLAAVAVLQM
uniref:Uncharacterized protein n=1 Tax=Arundo donax TaxID=35708 RepID=A0A0A9DK09_ARUDO